MGIIKESIVEQADSILEHKRSAVDILKQHNSLVLEKIASTDKLFVFNKLRRKVKEAAKQVSEKTFTDIKDGMDHVAAVRHQAEALFGKFVQPDEAKVDMRLRSTQLAFLVGAQLSATVQSQAPLDVKGKVIDLPSDTPPPPQPLVSPVD